MEIGSIVIINNICFKDKKIDEYFVHGRPCIYLGEIGDFMYFSPLIGLRKGETSKRAIIPNEFNMLRKTSSPQLHNIVKKRICFMETCGCLTGEELLNLVSSILSYKGKKYNDVYRLYLTLANNILASIKDDIQPSNKGFVKKIY